MKIVVVSDSHVDKSRLDYVYLKHQDADLFWHLGDYELPEYLLNNFMLIRGNCDFLSDKPLKKDITINNIKFHLEHGNLINYTYFDEYIENTNCDVFLFGHLHKKMSLKVNNTLVINPGSLTKSRDDSKGSYVVITFTSIEDLKVTFYSLEE